MIFNIFKSKPTLKDLIPEGFVDIHSHVLPGIDDGAKDVGESLSLISEMNKLGFSKIICTPHTYPRLFDNTNKSISNSFNMIKNNIPKKTKIDYASEYLIDSSLIDRINNKSILCLKDNYVLVEMSFLSPAMNFYEIIFELRTNNYIPVIAHPERYLYFNDNNLRDISKLKKMGCKFQLNFLSTTGYYGNRVLEMANKLIKKNIIDFIGSDFHNLNHIDQTLKKVKIKNLKKIEELFDNNINTFF